MSTASGIGPARRPGDPRFYAELKAMGDLHDEKQQGYGTEHDPFANYHAMRRFGVSPWRYVVYRIEEKMNRIQAAVMGERSVDVVEELRDIAIMAAIAKVLYEEDLKPVVSAEEPTLATEGAREGTGSGGEVHRWVGWCPECLYHNAHFPVGHEGGHAVYDRT
jgi:hypothetical protein